MATDSDEPRAEDAPVDFETDSHGVDRGRFLRTAAAAGVVAAAVPSISVEAALAQTRPKRGGRLRVGMTGAGTETWDPNNPQILIDIARLRSVFNRLADRRPGDGKIVPSLAESIEPNKKADTWVVRLREGIEWHDGKPLTADDVIYSYRRIANPKNALVGRGTLTTLDSKATKKLDKRTIRFKFLAPYVFFEEAAAASSNSIVQKGTTQFSPAKLVGTGPFKVVRITPTQRSLFARNPNYWDGAPYLAQLELILIADSTARLNALRAGQVDAIESIPASQVNGLKSSGFKVLVTPSGHWTPMCMDVTAAPFNDVRVRQALRLIADRKQMVASAYSGFGAIGNDLFGRFDAMYAGKDFPQRAQDIDQAKSLLRQAGQSNLKVQLQAADAATGMLASALVYSEQAKKAGITVEVVNNPADSYWDQQYLKTPFYYSDWADRPLDPQVGLCALENAAFNETHWNVPGFDKLVSQARQTVNPKIRKEIYRQAQRMLWNQGGYIIWGFSSYLDAHSSKVHGVRPNPERALGFYGFSKAWIG